MGKQILKYNYTKKRHTWNRSCLGLTFKFLENQLWICVTWDYEYKIRLHQFIFMVQNWVPDSLLIKTIQIGF